MQCSWSEIPLVQSWDEAWEELERLHIPTTTTQQQQLRHFHALLQEANQNFNLTRLSSLEEFLTFHLLDTALLLAALGKIPDAGQYLDLGSGGGIPGIILGILCSLPTTLCEPIGKKADFLKASISSLGEAHKLTVYREKAEKLSQQSDFVNKFSIVTARALAKPNVALTLAIPFLQKAPSRGVFLAQHTKPLSKDSTYLEGLSNNNAVIQSEHQGFLGGKPRSITLISLA